MHELPELGRNPRGRGGGGRRWQVEVHVQADSFNRQGREEWGKGGHDPLVETLLLLHC